MNDKLVYVPDIPMDIDEDDLSKLIQNRIESIQRMKMHSVKCYSKLGVAIIRMLDDNDKRHLVSTVESIVLHKDHGINITFLDELELDSYIVIDSELRKTLSADEVARHYADEHKTSKVCRCEKVSDQFPNLFRIFFKQLDELIQSANKLRFKINNVFATVYPRADCNFFEDLPQHINENEIRSSIAAQIDETQLSSTSFYVQRNKETGNAIVIASMSERKWAKVASLNIDGQTISKKHKLSYRLIVSPVPQGFQIDKILQHPLFTKRVVSNRHIDEKLIIELND